jgi:hypothetical protein
MIKEVLAEWSGMTEHKRRFLDQFTEDRRLWIEASASRIHQAVQRMFLRPKPESKALAMGCHRTPSRGAASGLEGATALVTPSPFKQAPAQAAVARSEAFASDDHAGTPSHQVSINLLFQGKKRGQSSNSGQGPHRNHSAKKARSQAKSELHPHDRKQTSQFQGISVLKASDEEGFRRAPREDARDSHLTANPSPGPHVGALAPGYSDAPFDVDESHQGGLADKGGARGTMPDWLDELQTAGCCDGTWTSATMKMIGTANFFSSKGRACVQGPSLTASTADRLLLYQEPSRRSSVDSTAHEFRSNETLARNPSKNICRSTPRHSRNLFLNNGRPADVHSTQPSLSDDQIVVFDIFRDEMNDGLSPGAGLPLKGEESSINKTHSGHDSNARPISNLGLVLQAHAVSAIVGPQEFNGIENRPPVMACEPLGRESSTSVVTTANLSSDAPATHGWDDVAYTPLEFFRLSPGDRSAASDVSESLRRLGLD